MADRPTKDDLSNAKKFPWQWLTYILLGVVSFLYAQVLLRVNKGDETCEQRIAKLTLVAARKDSIIYDWQGKYINLSNELLYKNNIIDRQNAVIQKTDSVARKKFEKPAKQIVKANE